jgi:hypothetical protein
MRDTSKEGAGVGVGFGECDRTDGLGFSLGARAFGASDSVNG